MITLQALKIGLLQLNSTVGDFAANRQKLVTVMKKPARWARNWSSRRNCFYAATRRAICSCALILSASLAALAETAKNIGPVPLCVGRVSDNSERPGRHSAIPPWSCRRCFHWRRKTEFNAAQAAKGLDLIDDRLFWNPLPWASAEKRSLLWAGHEGSLAAHAAVKAPRRPALRPRALV